MIICLLIAILGFAIYGVSSIVTDRLLDRKIEEIEKRIEDIEQTIRNKKGE